MTWDADWTIAPAELIAEWMQENGITVRILTYCHEGIYPTRHEAQDAIEKVLKKGPLTKRVAELLARIPSSPNARFWLALEHNYRVALKRGKKDTSSPVEVPYGN